MVAACDHRRSCHIREAKASAKLSGFVDLDRGQERLTMGQEVTDTLCSSISTDPIGEPHRTEFFLVTLEHALERFFGANRWVITYRSAKFRS